MVLDHQHSLHVCVCIWPRKGHTARMCIKVVMDIVPRMMSAIKRMNAIPQPIGVVTDVELCGRISHILFV